MSAPLERIKALVDLLVERGRSREARAVMRDISKLRYRTFPDKPDVGYDRFVSAYEDAQYGIRQTDVERARERPTGNTNDPTAKVALRELGLDQVDVQLEEIWSKHAELLDLPGRGRARTSVWRDEEAAQTVHDGYAQATHAEVRAQYPA